MENRFGKNSPTFRIIEGDAARFDYSSIKSGFKVVSNLPYYAATHIMKKLIHFGSRIQTMTLMMQKEVVDRLTAKPGSKEYRLLISLCAVPLQSRTIIRNTQYSFFTKT